MMEPPPPNDISRRRFIESASLIAAGTVLAQGRLYAGPGNMVDSARERAATANVSVKALRGGVSALIGAGGNIAVLPGSDGQLIVDAGYLASREKITEALTTISHDPISQLVNTHWHFDHTDGNEWMHSAGATITAHKRTRQHLSVDTPVEGWNFIFPPSPVGAIPTAVFQSEKKLQLNGETVLLKYYGNSHTDGDILIYFTEADVLHTGDTWWNGRYPFIDYSTGGNIHGMITAAETNLSMVTGKTIVIPGHGAIGAKADLTAYRDMLVAIRDRIAALKKEGKSLDEIVATKPTAAFDQKWAGSFVNGDFFTRLVYRGATP
jgi:glyoxylase-like metal-dependent hydrolase (beta-lactamase superfamily II)